MPQCSIIGCGTKTASKPPDVTLHRLPIIEPSRSAWLEIIGVENIDTGRKYIFVCSLHFEDSCFNRTMNIVKLRDGALPSQTLLPPTRPKVSGMLFERDENEVATLDYVYIKSEDMPLEHSTPEHSPSIYSNQDGHTLHIINKLKEKIQKQAKQIKRLNEKVRRQGKRIADLKTTKLKQKVI
ncbi:THAP domain-containing protein 2 isoform X2 [Spodoptera frugiperda]|uniref:THAP domain-containing protein 2 isoform X2 n=1 Tax=Spodoptera frugiperda TaxID=7108 RepID=A0A9R0DWZ4_SPOFR|nr:THAP domain-containing protein 2 isoform X2 [Spodoptera frugiperda]